MVAIQNAMRKIVRPIVALVALVGLTACDVPLPDSAASGPAPRGPVVNVALLVPKTDDGAATVARALENAARLAVEDRPRQRIELSVYDTGGDPEVASQQARQAVADGAEVILGPLFGESANAAGVAVANENVNVLSFSNTPGIAGGNVFILGQTFEATADRLMGFAADQGQQSVVVIHSDDVAGRTGRLAVEQAAGSAGVSVAAAEGYPLSIEGVAATAQRARASAQAGADTVFITTEATNAAMPMLLQMLPENGLPPGEVQFIGLTRWDVRPDLFTLPGAEGAWFALPDRRRLSAFEDRYQQTFGQSPHPLARLAYDGIFAVAALAADGQIGRASCRERVFPVV